MGSRRTFLILAVFVILYCNEVKSEKFNIRRVAGPPPVVANATPVAKVGYMVQQLTTKIDYVGQVLYFPVTRQLYSFDRKLNGSLYVWNKVNGAVTRLYIKELSNEVLASVMTVERRSSRLIIGSNRNLRYYEVNNTDYSISEPIVRFNDPGFIIYVSHCDNNGVMYTLLIGKTKETEHLGKLYKVLNDTATFVRDFFTTPRDFRFDVNGTLMYIVHENGRKIASIQYNLNTTQFGSSTDVFDKDEYSELKNHRLTSLVPDKNPGHLWVSAAGKEGLVLHINPFNKKLVSYTPLPSKDLTFMTFGLEENKVLFVGSKGTCTEGVAQGATYALSGLEVEGVPDYGFKYKNYNKF